MPAGRRDICGFGLSVLSNHMRGYAQMQELRIVFDATEAKAQMDELSKLLTEVFVEHLPDDVISYISGLALDISITDSSTAVGTDGITEKRILLRYGSRFHDIMTALRTGKFADLAHRATPIFRDSKL
jgi:hypothetical protein